MIELCIHDLAEIAGGCLRLGDLPPLGGTWEPVARFVADARQVQPGDVLLLLGQRRQDAGCVELAFERGALGVVADRRIEPWAGKFSIHVEDVQWVARQLARGARQRFGGRVIAVAGTVGKTITGAMINAVLREDGGGWWNEDQSAGELPLHLLGLPADSRYAVFELHAGQRGQLDDQAHLACPHVAVVASGAEGILPDCSAGGEASQARELLAALPDDGCAVVWGGAARSVRGLAGGVRLRTYGREAECEVRASHVCSSGGQLAFAVDGQRARLAAWGRHLLGPALAAWSVGRSFGVREAEISRRLAGCELPRRRCEVACRGGATLIDDTHCSRQPSLRAGLELLQAASAPGRRIAVCGELADADGAAPCAYRRWGQQAVTTGGADLLLAAGRGRSDIAAGARSAGMRAADCREFASIPALTAALAAAVEAGDAVLFKGVGGECVDELAASIERRTAARRAAA